MQTLFEDRVLTALSFTQPWATLMAIGAKRIETRSWSTRYRGRVAIHAAKGFGFDDQRLCFRQPFNAALAAVGIISPSQLPRGAVIGTGQLVGVEQVGMFTALPDPDSMEFAFGDFGVGRYLWYFEDLQPLDEPIPARGSLGLWEWTP